jgi:hypothetical protein
LTELQTKWIKAVEDYYRDTYPKTMRAKIAAMLPHSPAALHALYETLIHSVSAKYRTVPDVIAIQAALNESVEAYPEVWAPSVALIQEAPRGSSVKEWLKIWTEAMAEGINPVDYEPMRKFMRSQGVEPDDPTTQDAG